MPELNIELIETLLKENKPTDDAICYEACKHGVLTLVKSFLSQPNNIDLNKALFNAIQFGQIEIVEYLLTSPAIENHEDINTNKEQAFITACEHNQVEILRYFVFDLDLSPTSEIKEYLTHNPQLDAIKFFKLKELNVELNQKLKGNFSFDKMNSNNKPKL